MTSRLALCATVAATVLFCNVIGASAQTYEVTKLVPGSAFHGVHGLGVDKSGRLFAGSVAGAALYEVDRNNGTAEIVVPTPEGMADDIAFAPDGTMAWTGFLTGDLYSRKGDGPIKKLASGLPGINSLGIGNTPPTIAYGPGVFNLDFSLAKQFRIKESKSLEFRVETFNTLNHFNPDVLSSANRTLNYNLTTGAQTNASFGVISGAAVQARRTVLSARFKF